uniref:CTHL1 protein n=1 Tax=Anas zonorhyncha TaxID=75864 RepID=A0A8B9UH26_9AVES
MASCWVLLLLGLGGACALPAPAPLAYSQALAQAVDSFNQRPEVHNAFRLLSADPEPAPDVQLSSLRSLNFTIMETRCPARTGARPDSCDFKEDGVSWGGPLGSLGTGTEVTTPWGGLRDPLIIVTPTSLPTGDQGLLRPRGAAERPPRA